MEQPRTNTIFRAIAYYEILGAAWSMQAFIRLVLHSPGVLIPWSWLALITGAYVLVGAAGALLLRGHAFGEVLSIVAQGLQVFQITVGPVAFRFVAGLQASIFFLGHRFTYFVGATASLNLWRGANDVAFAIGVNLVPVAILIALARLPSPALAQRSSPGGPPDAGSRSLARGPVPPGRPNS